MILNKTIWEVLALFPWMVIFSSIVIHITPGLPPVVSLPSIELITYALIGAMFFANGYSLHFTPGKAEVTTG